MVVLFAQQFLQDQKRLTINNTEAQKPMNSANAYEFLANSQNHNNTVKESNNKYIQVGIFILTQINDLYKISETSSSKLNKYVNK